MQPELWKALLRRIPEQQFDNLMLMTAQGTEVNVQAVLRMEAEVVVLRGRLAGSTDGGRIFILPYQHLDHIGFQRPLTEAQLQEIFGSPAPTESPPPQPQAPPVPSQTAAADSDLVPRLPTRSKLMERLRQRAEVRDAAKPAPERIGRVPPA